MNWDGSILFPVCAAGVATTGAVLLASVGRFEPWVRERTRQISRQWWAVFDNDTVGSRRQVRASNIAALGVALMLFLGLVGGVLGVGMGVGLWLFGPAIVRQIQARRRQQRFEEQLPDALAAIASSMRSGLTFPAALAAIGSRFPDPVATIFRDASSQVRIGVSIGRALRDAKGASGLLEWEMYLSAIDPLLAQGGNLAGLTERTAQTIRRRRNIRQRLRSLTAQARMQSWLMGALPPAMIVVMAGLDPVLFAQLTGTVLGWMLLVAAAVLELAAIYLARRIMSAPI